jgi:transaldolase
MSLQSLIVAGTKLWLDSIDPELIKKNRARGITGATSNPIIISELIKTGRFDADLLALIEGGNEDSDIAWELTDRLVREAQNVFFPVWQQTKGNNGYVSFELDPLLEDISSPFPFEERVDRYVELGKLWSAGFKTGSTVMTLTPD